MKKIVSLIVCFSFLIFPCLSQGTGSAGNAETYLSLAAMHYMNEDYDSAIDSSTQAIRINPNLANAYALRGLSYSGKEEYDRAIADLNQAIRLDPNNAMAYDIRGSVYWNKDDFTRAIADYTQEIRINPTEADAYGKRGLMYMFLPKPELDRAIADFQTALRLNPDDSRSAMWLRQAQQQRGQKK